jgi:polar amino acid transport system substrate-binding protein
MRKNKTVRLLIGLFFCLFLAQSVSARTFRASMASMPQSAEIDEQGRITGAYVELVRALDRLTGSRTQIEVVPFKRSILNLIEGRADFHIPLIEPPNTDISKLPYAFSTQTLFQVAFVLYTHKDKPLDTAHLGKYEIATDSAHTAFFDFPTIGITCLSCTIKMVNEGRLDGFIFAQNEIDPYIREAGLNNIHRQLYKNFDVKILVPKGEAGQKIDHYFNTGIQALKASGEYDWLLAPVLSPYRDWQP